VANTNKIITCPPARNDAGNVQNVRQAKIGSKPADAKNLRWEAARRGWKGRSSLAWRESDRARTGTSLM
jgi:hypothetical protein